MILKHPSLLILPTLLKLRRTGLSLGVVGVLLTPFALNAMGKEKPLAPIARFINAAQPFVCYAAIIGNNSKPLPETKRPAIDDCHGEQGFGSYFVTSTWQKTEESDTPIVVVTVTQGGKKILKSTEKIARDMALIIQLNRLHKLKLMVSTDMNGQNPNHVITEITK